MTPPSPASGSRSHCALRRWLRYSWLSRLPLVGRFFRPHKPKAPPRPTRQTTPLETLQLEVRSVPNDPFGMAQAALGSSALAEMTGTFQTPAQVLLRGWGGGAASSWQDPRALQGQPYPGASNGAELLRPSLSDAYFAPLNVAPRREDDNEARPQEAQNKDRPTQTEPERFAQPQEPERLVLAADLMRDPVDDDFLDRVGQALQGPLPATAGSGGGAGAGGAASAANEHSGTGVSSDAGTSGPFAAASDPGPHSGSGGGAGVSPAGSDSGFDPFLATGFGQGGRLPAAPAAPTVRGNAGATGAIGGTGSAAGIAAGAGQATSPPSVPASPAGATATGSALPIRPVAATPPSLAANFGKLPLAFEVNQGQADPSVRFVARGNGYSIALTPTGAVLTLA
ncbi:MAG TPA: hypothetical protein VKD72_15020, partial [Gemmataceae bacterium]|nr:hypothetical protein [Gemmataceae bacterium]